MGGELTIFTKIPIPIFQFIIFLTDELQLQFPFQFVSCNSGNQFTEWNQLLISDFFGNFDFRNKFEISTVGKIF